MVVALTETLLQRIMRHEGWKTRNGSHFCFKDSGGKNTVDYGMFIDFPGDLTEVEARYLLQNEYSLLVWKPKLTIPGFLDLDTFRQHHR